MTSYILGITADTLQIIMFFIGFYYLLISLFSFIPFKHATTADDFKKIAVVIPAYNEENVISDLILSLKAQKYPKDYYNIFVIDDFCTDTTEQIAKQNGAVILKRRTSKGTKGTALHDAFKQLIHLDYDAFVVIDADNIADRNFLDEINNSIYNGYSVVQGYVDTFKPDSSQLSYSYALWYWISNRIFQTAFYKAGIGCRINGTGFAISKDTLLSVPWVSNSLAEDMEYTALLCMQNIKIGYSPNAVVYDRKPNKLSVSVRQRQRWARGIVFVLKKYMLIFFKKNKIKEFTVLTADFMMPLCLGFFSVIDLLVIFKYFDIISLSISALWWSPLNFFLLNLYLAGTCFVILYGLYIDKKLSMKIFKNLSGIVIYFLSWIPTALSGIFTSANKSWYHTGH